MNNPAGQILYWLELGAARTRNLNAMSEWCAVFQLDPNHAPDRAECVRRGLLLTARAVEVRREAALLPDNIPADMMLEHFGQVEAVLENFTLLPSLNIANMFGSLRDTGWHSLKMLDRVLSQQSTRPAIDPDTVREHLAELRALISDIATDETLSTDLRRYILDRLHDVERALTDALVNGSRGLEVAINGLHGAHERERDLWDRVAQTKWAPRIGAIWMALVTTLSAAGGIPALMPGGDAPPQQQTVLVIPFQHTPKDASPEHKDDDIVDAELVDDDDSAASGG